MKRSERYLMASYLNIVVQIRSYLPSKGSELHLIVACLAQDVIAWLSLLFSTKKRRSHHVYSVESTKPRDTRVEKKPQTRAPPNTTALLCSVSNRQASSPVRCFNFRAQRQPPQTVVLKAVRSDHFENEVASLGHLRDQSSFRQLVDLIQNQPVMVLEYRNDNIQHVVNMRPKRKLEL